MKNESNDCVKGLGVAVTKHYIENSCSGEPDPSLKDWTRTFIPRMDLENIRPISHVTWPVMRIQCYSKNITIISPHNRTTTTSCPGYTISINLVNTFRTSDGSINHIGGGTKRLLTIPKVNTDVLNFHFEDEDFLPIHKELEDSIKLSEDALQAQEKARNATVVFSINERPIYVSSLIYIIIVLAIFLNFIIGYRCYLKNRRSKSRRELARTEALKRVKELKETKLAYELSLAGIDAWKKRSFRDTETRSLSSRRSIRTSRSTHRAIHSPGTTNTTYTVVPTVVPTILNSHQ